MASIPLQDVPQYSGYEQRKRPRDCGTGVEGVGNEDGLGEGEDIIGNAVSDKMCAVKQHLRNNPEVASSE